jgi:hypothetical protein
MATKTRTGARSFLDILLKACRLSHTPGFVAGMAVIAGPAFTAEFMAAWSPVCLVLEAASAADDEFNRKDATSPSALDSEDDNEGA